MLTHNRQESILNSHPFTRLSHSFLDGVCPGEREVHWRGCGDSWLPADITESAEFPDPWDMGAVLALQPLKWNKQNFSQRSAQGAEKTSGISDYIKIVWPPGPRKCLSLWTQHCWGYSSCPGSSCGPLFTRKTSRCWGLEMGSEAGRGSREWVIGREPEGAGGV